MENYYRVHRDWVERDEAPYAFVVSADQRDPFETYELLDLLQTGEVEIHQARGPFTAGGESYPVGSWVIQLAQPAGAFAKTMLEQQVYPDLRYYPGGPPIPPYDVTAQTLGMLMGVDVDQIDEPVRADLELVDEVAPRRTPMPAAPGWGYLVGPGSNAAFLAAARLQRAGVRLYRAAEAFESNGHAYAPGTWLVPPSREAAGILEGVSRETGLVVGGASEAPDVPGFRMRAPTRVGLWRGANNMPGGWMRWLFEQYELGHIEISSLDFAGDLSDTYDVIVLPAGTTRTRIVFGLDPQRHDESWRWAYGVGNAGWQKLAQWVRDGGTLVALGSAVSTARELLDLPIEPVLPQRRGRATPPEGSPRDADETAELRETFQSPAQLLAALRDRVVDPTSLFYCPGSLLKQEFDPTHPVAFGMPERWPVFFRFDQAYRLTPSFDITAETVSLYPDEADMVASGWLLGDELLRNQANVVAFTVGTGSVVTLGSQIAFRTQTRGTFKLLFNAIFQGPGRDPQRRGAGAAGLVPRLARVTESASAQPLLPVSMTSRAVTMPSAPNPLTTYQRLLDERRGEETALVRRADRVSTARLATFAVGAVLAWGTVLGGWMSSWWLSLPVGVFLWLVVLHDQVLTARDRVARAVAWYEHGIARLEDRWPGLGARGDRFADAEQPLRPGPGPVWGGLTLSAAEYGADTSW